METRKIVYNGCTLDEYSIDCTGCVKNVITGNICKPFEVQKSGSVKLYVSLKINSTFVNVPLHRILAETFIPNPNNCKYVLFKDGDYRNIIVENLTWSKHTSIDYEERRRKKNVEKVSKRRQKLKNMAVEYKGGKCFICGYDRCIAALEFHHINPDEKDFMISKDGYTRSWENVKKELNKCVCVCANCHREIHNGIIDLKNYL